MIGVPFAVEHTLRTFLYTATFFNSSTGLRSKESLSTYGLKSSGAAWTQADPDVWIKRAVKGDGTPYYKMMLIYVDDVLRLSEDSSEDIDKHGKLYRLKNGTGQPGRYLGGNIERVQTDDGSIAWSLSCYDYLSNAILQFSLNSPKRI